MLNDEQPQANNPVNDLRRDPGSDKKLRVINIGLLQFYDALVFQNVHAIQMDWQPPVEHSEEINDLLDKFL